jgi:hypothetical protein
MDPASEDDLGDAPVTTWEIFLKTRPGQGAGGVTDKAFGPLGPFSSAIRSGI